MCWRRNPESNRATRICNPLHNHSAIAPTRSITQALIILQKRFLIGNTTHYTCNCALCLGSVEFVNTLYRLNRSTNLGASMKAIFKRWILTMDAFALLMAGVLSKMIVNLNSGRTRLKPLHQLWVDRAFKEKSLTQLNCVRLFLPNLERETRLELATSTLARLRSTN